MSKWTPETIIAIIVIIAGVGLKCVGFDGEIWALVVVASGFLFGKGYQVMKYEHEMKSKE
jgi:uncharacterized membrane protein YkgB